MSVKENKSIHRLGRGLETMFGRSFVGGGRSVIEIPIESIVANEFQPREIFDESAIDCLVNSIKKNGLAQPILVRPLDSGQYELIAGERRLRACKKAGFKSIPSIVKQISNLESLQLALVENLDREDLNPLEEAQGYNRLITEFNYTHQTLADLFGRSRSKITNSIRLLMLPPAVKKALQKNIISEGHARTLLSLEKVEQQEEVLTQIIVKKMSVRELEALISNYKKNGVPKRELVQKEVETLPLFSGITRVFNERSLKVTCAGNEKKGKITISYKSESEFKELMGILSS